MKRCSQVVHSLILMCGFTLVATCNHAQSLEQVEAAKTLLVSVAPGELPTRAVTLVSSAPQKERLLVAAAVSKAVAQLRPAATVATVYAIATKHPELAPATAAAAAAILPKQAPAIAEAAVNVPRVKIDEIKTAVLAAAPDQAQAICRALALD